MKKIISFREMLELKDHPDALLMLTKPVSGFDYSAITFKTRHALESFNKKAGLKAVIPTQVPLNCAIYAHQSDSVARAEYNAQHASVTV